MFRSLGSKSLFGGLSVDNMQNWNEYCNGSIDLHSKYKIINSIDPSSNQDLSTKNYVDTNINNVKNDGVNSLSWNKIINFPITPIASSDLGQLIPSIDASGNVVFNETSTPSIDKSIFTYNINTGKQEWNLITHTYISDFNTAVNSLISALTITISDLGFKQLEFK